MCPPSPCASSRGRNVWIPLTTPPSSTSRPQSQSSYRASVTGPRMPMPALLQSTCTLPKTRSASSAARARPSRSVTSSSIACTFCRRPLPAKRSRAASRWSGRRSAITTFIPAATNASLMPRPIPLAPPVTNAVLPATSSTRRAQSPGQEAIARAFPARRPSSTANRSAGTGSSGNAARISSKISRSSSRWSGCVKT